MNPDVKSVRVPALALRKSEESIAWKLTLPRIVRRPDGIMAVPLGTSYVPINSTDKTFRAGWIHD